MPAGKSFIIEKGMISGSMGKTAIGGEEYYNIRLKNQTLHAVHPLGWFTELNVKIDGQDIPKKDIIFELRDQRIGMEHMSTIKDIFWYIMEPAYLHVKMQGELAPGAHEVACEVVAPLLEVGMLLDAEGKWPRRHQTITGTVTL